jgi:hypothetical protein
VTYPRIAPVLRGGYGRGDSGPLGPGRSLGYAVSGIRTSEKTPSGTFVNKGKKRKGRGYHYGGPKDFGTERC